MMSDSGSGLEPTPFQNVSARFTKVQRQYQQILDRWTPHTLYRWLSTAGLLCLFFLRIVLAQGVRSFIHSLALHKRFLYLTRILVVYWLVLN